MAPKTLMDFISESQHIMKAPSSLLHPHPPLLLPHLILSPTLFHLFNLHQRITANTNPSSLIVFLLLYSLFVSLFSTCGVIDHHHLQRLPLLQWPSTHQPPIRHPVHPGFLLAPPRLPSRRLLHLSFICASLGSSHSWCGWACPRNWVILCCVSFADCADISAS